MYSCRHHFFPAVIIIIDVQVYFFPVLFDVVHNYSAIVLVMTDIENILLDFHGLSNWMQLPIFLGGSRSKQRN